MTERAQKVLEEARGLPVAERARIVAELLAGLEGEPDVGAEQQWALEIERRAQAVAAGEASAGEADEVLDDLEKSLGR